MPPVPSLMPNPSEPLSCFEAGTSDSTQQRPANCSCTHCLNAPAAYDRTLWQQQRQRQHGPGVYTASTTRLRLPALPFIPQTRLHQHLHSHPHSSLHAGPHPTAACPLSPCIPPHARASDCAPLHTCAHLTAPHTRMQAPPGTPSAAAGRAARSAQCACPPPP